MNAVALELKALMLAKPRLTLAVAESLTAGNVQARVASVSGSSEYFRGGVTAYTLEQKVKLLGVDRAAAKKVDCVSADVAEQMARGACALFDADVAVATTGYAEPFGIAQFDTTHRRQGRPLPGKNVAVPFAWWAVAHRGTRGKFSVRHGRVECPGATRTDAQAIVADATLAELVAFLRELRG